MKRILAVFLTLAMVLNIAPMGALAASGSDAASIQAVAETEETASSAPDEETAQAIASDPFLQGAEPAPAAQNGNVEVDTSDVSVTATNSLGQLLVASMDDQTNGIKDDYGDSRIVDVTVHGDTATVEYYTLQPLCDIIVAVYTDDAQQEMVASGKGRAETNLLNKTDTLDIQLEGTIPASFVVKAYMVSTLRNEPACNAYTSSRYTNGMQELEQATADDFDEARTIDLDGDVTTNFAVVNEGVELLKPDDVKPGEDQVTLQDDTGMTYVIENASSRIRSLQPGEILVYPQADGGILIARVKDIQVDGTTVTITGDQDLDLDDVFDVLKVEDTASTADFDYVEGSAEGVTYAGLAVPPADYAAENGKGDDGDDQISKELTVDHKMGSLTITGSVYAGLGYGIKVLKDGSQKYITTYMDTNLQGTVTLTGKYDEAFEVGELSYTNPLLGIYAGIKPTLEVHADAYVEFTFTANKYNGFEFTYTGLDLLGGSCTDISKPAECKLYTKAEGELYVGINLRPSTYALGGIVSIDMDARIGVTGTFELQKADKEDPSKESLHTCDFCLAFNLEGSTELTVHLKVSVYVLFVGDLTKKWDKQLFTYNWNIGDAYYSVVHDEFGWGTCPYRTYRVKVAAGTKAAGASLSVVQKSDPVLDNQLDANGEYCMFLEPGSYTVKINVNKKEYQQEITVGSSAQTVEFTVEDVKEDPDTSMTWTLDANGTLTISGKGDMPEYDFVGEDMPPWEEQKDQIKKVVIRPGLTSVGVYAFYKCTQLQEVVIPNGVTKIGRNAFESCEQLQKVTIPEGVTEIGFSAFYGCKALQTIALPDSVVDIGSSAFDWCESLTSITVPGKVTAINEGTFYSCKALKKVTLPAGIKVIGDQAFGWCKSLPEITIPDGVTNIGESAFFECSSLTAIRIPDSVISIGEDAFAFCEALTEATLPVGKTHIAAYMFAWCDALKKITIPASVTYIGDNAFRGCKALETVVYGGSQDAWNAIRMGTDNEYLQNAAIQYENKKPVTNSCGTNLTWKLDENDTLTISGHGDMTDYESYQTPWYDQRNRIKKVVIEPGVTSIGEYAFYNFWDSLTEVSIADSVTRIGQCAFAICHKLTEVTIPASVTSIGDSAFVYCEALTKVTIPASVTSIGDGAFRGCKSLQDVYYTGTEAQWNAININSSNDKLTGATIHYNSTAGGSFGVGGGGGRFALEDEAQPVENSVTTGTAAAQGSAYCATFENAEAGRDYVVVISRNKVGATNSSNLLYINQITAESDGELSVVFRTSAAEDEIQYVVACANDAKPENPDQPDKPSSDGGSGGGGGGAAIALIGGVVAVAAVAGVVMMLPVDVQGTVKLADQPVANATVQVLKADSVAAQTTTDANGHFAVKVRRGDYTLRVMWTDAEGQPVTRTVDFTAPDTNLNLAA